MASLTGTNADETITPTFVSPTVTAVGGAAPGAGADIVDAGGGNDFVDGGGGDDSILLGTGNDAFIWNPGNGSDTVEGGADFDLLVFNGGGNFTISANGTRTRLAVGSVTMDVNDVESIQSTASTGDDVVTVQNLNGTDVTQLTVNLGAGDDVLNASLLAAGQVELTVNAGLGDDVLICSQGDDRVGGGDGDDTALLGAGNDVFVWNPGDDNDTLEGQAGTDQLEFNGGNVSKRIDIAANGGRARLFRDVATVSMDMDDVERIDFNALGGVDFITVNDLAGTDVTQVAIDLAGTLGGGAGDGQFDRVTVNGTNDADAITISASGGTVVVSGLATQVLLGHGDATDQLIINGLAGNDVIDASGLAPGLITLVLDGGIGADILKGSAGNDSMDGGGDANAFNGNDGNDFITSTGSLNVAFGDQGGDQLFFVGNQNQLFGGEGNDWLGVSGTNNALVGGSGDDFLGATGSSNTLAGEDGNDSLSAGGSSNFLHGQSGNDWLGVSGSSNTLLGGAGIDYLAATGTGNALAGGDDGDTLFSVGSNILYGEAGNDWLGCSGNGNILFGNDGADYLAATGSNNVLDGGTGNDTLEAAAGHINDLFVFHAGYGQDAILNFLVGGGDVVNLETFGLANFAALQPFMAQVGSDVVITLNGADILTMRNVTLGTLSANDFDLA